MLASLSTLFSAASLLLLAVIFAIAGAHKLPAENRQYYRAIIEQYNLPFISGFLSSALGTAMSALIGAFEVLIALALLFQATRAYAAVLGCLLLLLYWLAIAKQLWQGRTDMDCGCAGPAASIQISQMLLVRNALLILLLFLSATSTVSLFRLDWLLLALAVFFVLIYFSAEQLIGNAQKLKNLRH